MWWPFQWVVIYVLGGLTFVPLLVVVVIGYALTYGSTPIGDPDPAKKQKAKLEAHHEKQELMDKAKNAAATAKPLSGWLTVRRQFQPYNANTSIFAPSMAVSTSNTGLAHVETEEEPTDKDDASIRPGGASQTASSTATAVPTTYSARIAQTYRQMVEARQKKEAPPKEYLFAILKGNVLFLYEDEAASDCVAAIGLNKYVVGVEGKDGGRFEGKDAEMFAKRNAIVMRIYEKDRDAKDGVPALTKGTGTGAGEGGHEDEKESESAPWFLFSKSNTKMEDWYLALTAASALQPTTTEVFSENDMQALVDTIDTEPDPIPMRWLNAMLGRMFFGLYRTEALEQFIIGRIMKKLTKVPRPSFLGPIIIREVNVGTSSPIFSKPMLKELTADGSSSFEVHLNYQSRLNQPNSEIRITIATTATIPTGFKPYVVDLVLAVVIKSFEGNIVMQIKKPPSNRLWYGFTYPPKMEIEIQPVVSERKIQIGMVLKAIEKQLRDVIAESVVLPNMDDIAFFDSSKLDIRGGIFSSAGKVTKGPTADLPTGGTEPPTQPGIDIDSVTEGLPVTAVEAPGLRRRVPTKANIIDTNNIGSLSSNDLTEGESPVSRNDTAPAFGATAQSSRPVSAKPTKNWFTGTGRPSSITSLTGAAGSNSPGESVDKPRSSSINSMDQGRIDRAHLLGGQPEAVSSGPDADPHEDVVSPVSPVEGSPRKEGVSSPEVAARLMGVNPGTSTIGGAEHETPISPANSTASTASLITSLRSRDKKAIQSQVNTARDAVKKWGVNWAAKTRTNISALTEEDGTRPAPIYRPPDEDEFAGTASTTTPGKSPEGPRSLQDRLNAAAALAATTRPKSGSVSSTSPISVTKARPTLQPSPASKATTTTLGTSPPQWTLSNAGPTVGIARDVSAKPTIPSPPKPNQEALTRSLSNSRTTHDQRASTSTPVFTQPSAGRSMVVPRVPKRAGEVVGMGSSQTGFTRRISGGDERDKRAETPDRAHSRGEASRSKNADERDEKHTAPPGPQPKNVKSTTVERQGGDVEGFNLDQPGRSFLVMEAGSDSAKTIPSQKPDEGDPANFDSGAVVQTPSVPSRHDTPIQNDTDDEDDQPLSNIRSSLAVSAPDADETKNKEINPEIHASSKQPVSGNSAPSALKGLRSRSQNASAEDLLRNLVSRDHTRERSEPQRNE